MAGTYLPLAALLLATAVTLIAATSAVPVAAAADKNSGRMIIIRNPRTRVVSAGGALPKWQQRRLVEDEVAAELGSLLGAGGGGLSYGAFKPNQQVCLLKCALPGKPYTQDHCTYVNHCPQNPPTAEHARTMHA